MQSERERGLIKGERARERKKEPAREKERARSCARERVSIFEFLDNVMCSCLDLSLMRFGSCVFVSQVVDDGSIYSAASATAGCCTYSCVFIHFFLYPHAHIMLNICAYLHTLSLSVSPSSHTERERERESCTCRRWQLLPRPTHMHARTLACAWAH